jgi:hypothetical protein
VRIEFKTLNQINKSFIMPKNKTSLTVKMKQIASKYPDDLKVSEETKILYCICCEKSVKFDHQHGQNRVNEHFQSPKHLRNKKLKSSQNQFINDAFKKNEDKIYRQKTLKNSIL